jgi:hypothetical protein
MLMDLLWSIHLHLEEFLVDALHVAPESTPAASADSSKPAPDPADVEKARKIKKDVEGDRQTLTDILRGLLVSDLIRVVCSCSMLTSRQSMGLVDSKACEVVDAALLQGAGLLTDKEVFQRKEVRARTSLL